MGIVAIAGVPQSGKTTLAKELDPGAWHTDDLLHLPWSEQSEAVSHWFDSDQVKTIEGVRIPHALRKWLERNSDGKPCDEVIFLNEPRVALGKGQHRMAKGCRTVWLQIVGELKGRGVIVEER